MENLVRPRERGLGTKRAPVFKEFVRGIDGLERFVRGQPLQRVHERMFGVLVLGSEPADPRLQRLRAKDGGNKPAHLGV